MSQIGGTWANVPKMKYNFDVSKEYEGYKQKIEQAKKDDQSAVLARPDQLDIVTKDIEISRNNIPGLSSSHGFGACSTYVSFNVEKIEEGSHIDDNPETPDLISVRKEEHQKGTSVSSAGLTGFDNITGGTKTEYIEQNKLSGGNNRQVIIKQQQDHKGNKLSYIEVDTMSGEVIEEWNIAK